MNAVQAETISPTEGASGSPAANPTRPRRRSLLIAVTLLVVLGLCAGTSALLFTTIAGEKAPLEASIDTFMRALSRDDFDGAHAQLCSRAKQSIEPAELEDYFSKANKALVAGYLSAEIDNINISWKADADPDAPQGQVAEVDGTLAYRDNYTGSFSAIFEREGGGWRIYGINLTVPPQKLEDYLKGVAQ